MPSQQFEAALWVIATVDPDLCSSAHLEESSLGEIYALKDRVVSCTVSSESSDWMCQGDGYRATPCDRDHAKNPDHIDLRVGLDDLPVDSGEPLAYESFSCRRKDESVIRCFWGPEDNA